MGNGQQIKLSGFGNEKEICSNYIVSSWTLVPQETLEQLEPHTTAATHN